MHERVRRAFVPHEEERASASGRVERSLSRLRESKWVVLAALLLLNAAVFMPRIAHRSSLRGVAHGRRAVCDACPLHVASSAGGFETLGREVLVESAHARVERHSVLLPRRTAPADASWSDGEEEHEHELLASSQTPPNAAAHAPRHPVDWLWLAMPDSVDVLIEIERGEFLVFNSTKYGLHTPTLALAGGSARAGEDTDAAARRTVRGEMGLECDRWETLGARAGQRTLGSRGGPLVRSYLASECHVIVGIRDEVRPGTRAAYAPIAADEVEAQRVVRLSGAELRVAFENGVFAEASASNTVGLALLRQIEVYIKQERIEREVAALALAKLHNISATQRAAGDADDDAASEGKEATERIGNAPYTPITPTTEIDGRERYAAYQKQLQSGTVVAPVRDPTALPHSCPLCLPLASHRRAALPLFIISCMIRRC